MMQQINLHSKYSQVMMILLICLVISCVWYLVPHPLVIMVFGILPIAILAATQLPIYMVLGFVIFSFFRIHEVFPPLYPLKIPLLFSFASLATLAWHIIFTGKVQPYWRKEHLGITLFFFLVIVGVPLATNRAIAIDYFKNMYWKIAFMTFAITWLTRESKDFILASGLITLSGLVVGIKAISNKLQGIDCVEGTRVTIGRALDSVLSDPNDLALVLMFPTSFAVGLALTAGVNKGLKWIGMIGMPVLFYSIIATQSRGGLLGMLAVMGFFGYRRIENKVLFLSGGFIAASVLYLAMGISDRASGGAAEEGVDASAMGRIHAWEAAIKMATHNPLTGVGLDNFYANYYYYTPVWDGLSHAVHSTWFGVLAETGFLGLGVFIYVLVLLIKSAHKSLTIIERNLDTVPAAIHATSQSLLAGMLGTITAGTFLTQGFTWPIYILAALIIAMSHWVYGHCEQHTLEDR